jgi:hypothetical protein
MRSVIKALQADVLGTLLACDWFEDVTVIAEDIGDFATVINQALGSTLVKANKTGVVVIVNEPEAQAPTTLPAPYFTLIRQKITILENRIINRSAIGTNKSAYLIAETIQQLLFESSFAGTTGGPCWPGTPAIEPLGIINDRQELTGVAVNIEAHAPLQQPNKCVAPTITQGATTITLASSGNSILYSVDDSFPSTAYSVPFANPAAGVTVRAIAKRSTYAASNISAHVVTA